MAQPINRDMNRGTVFSFRFPPTAQPALAAKAEYGCSFSLSENAVDVGTVQFHWPIGIGMRDARGMRSMTDRTISLEMPV